LSGLRTRLRRAFQRGAMDQQMLDEMKHHLDEETARRIAAGEDPSTARRRAAADFGSVDARTEEVRERRWGTWVELWWHDFVQAVRSLRRDHRFSVVVIVTLALGIGASTSVYSVVDRVLLNPVPGPHADSIMQVGEWSYYSENPAPQPSGITPPILQALLDNSDAFPAFTWCDRSTQMSDREDGFVTTVFGSRVPPGFFRFFGVQPVLGRTFTDDEALNYDAREPPRDSAIVLSHAWWKSRFQGDPTIIGQTVRIGDRLLTVTGVMPNYFQFPSRSTQYWLPAQPVRPRPNHMRAANTIALLKLPPDGRLARLEVLLDTIAAQLQQDETLASTYRSVWQKNTDGLQLWVRPLHEALQGRVYSREFPRLRETLNGLSLAIALVLLIVCANTAHLTLARTERRRRELAVRAALGARRGRLIRQLLLESTVLAVVSGVAALVLTHWGLHLLASLNQLPQLRPIELDGRALAIAFAVTALTVLCFGLWPAWRGSHTPINAHLKNSGNTATLSIGARRQGRLLASLEVALALILLSGAGLMIRSVIEQLRAPPGFASDHLLSAVVSFLPTGGFSPDADTRTHIRVSTAMDRLAALPGVEAVGSYKLTGLQLPAENETGDVLGFTGRSYISLNQRDFFQVAQAPLLGGRFLTSADQGDENSAVVINETMARDFWPNQDAMGRTFRYTNGGARTFQVVGVVGDARLLGVDEPVTPQFFRPLNEAPSWGMPNRFLLRTSQDPALLATAVRAALREVDADMQLPHIETMTSALYDSTQARRTYRNYLCVFAVAAVVLAALGIHSVLAYSVARRTREIGIRIALGADQRQVVAMIVGEGGRVVMAGIALGLVGALALGHLIRAQLYGVAPSDAWVLAMTPILLATIALIACWLPARHAARIDPLAALRTE
ncbi:ABC transporter permease, partial [Synoicihabitans lomoniglobus]|nr:ABC transporter permease [Opitutaceae bacterium LMO-M01]